MTEQVRIEVSRQDCGRDWYPLRKWWQPFWLFNQDFGQSPFQERGDVWRMDLLQRWLPSRSWPEYMPSPLLVPYGSRSVQPPGPGISMEQYKWRVSLDVAHFAPSQISISTTGGFLEIGGDHKERPDEHGFIARSFTRKYRLPVGIDLAKITSILSGDGILYVEAPLNDSTIPADIIIPIQVETGTTELQDEEPEVQNLESTVLLQSAPEAPAQDQVGPDTALPTEAANLGDPGEESLRGVEACSGSAMDGSQKQGAGREQQEEECPAEAAAGVGEGSEDPPEPIQDHEAQQSLESTEGPGTAESDQKEDATPQESQPAQSSGEAAAEVTQPEVPTEAPPSNQGASQEPGAVEIEQDNTE